MSLAPYPQGLIAFAAMYFLASAALAQEIPVQNPAPGAPPVLPLWEAGLFGAGVTQPAYPGSAGRAKLALVLPYLIYRGKYLRADRDTLGVRALKTPRIEVDMGVAGSLGSHSSDVAERRGMADLGYMIELGPRLKINLGDVSSGRSNSRLQFPLRKVIDVSHGFRSSGVAFEPQWVTERSLPSRWFISTSLGALFGDEKLNETFYGVAPGEALPSRPVYKARSGLISIRAGLYASHSLTADVLVFNFIRLDSSAASANRDSPLVRRNIGWSAGIGFAWTLARSADSAIE
jgi:outer membrane protein